MAVPTGALIVVAGAGLRMAEVLAAMALAVSKELDQRLSTAMGLGRGGRMAPEEGNSRKVVPVEDRLSLRQDPLRLRKLATIGKGSVRALVGDGSIAAAAVPDATRARGRTPQFHRAVDTMAVPDVQVLQAGGQILVQARRGVESQC